MWQAKQVLLTYILNRLTAPAVDMTILSIQVGLIARKRTLQPFWRLYGSGSDAETCLVHTPGRPGA